MQILGFLGMYFDAVVLEYEKNLLSFKYCDRGFAISQLIHNFRGKCLPIPGKRLPIPGKRLPIPGKRLPIPGKSCLFQANAYFSGGNAKFLLKLRANVRRKKKRMLLQIVCLHYSVITVTVNFS